MPTDEAQTNQKPEPTPAAATEAPKPAPAPAAAPTPAPERATAASEEARQPRRVKLTGNDDEIPEDADVLEFSPSHFKSRLTRAKNSAFKELGATPDTIKADLEELKKRRAKDEEKRLQEMSEKERYETELRKERQLRADAELRAARVQDERDISRTESRITKIADKFLDEDPDTREVVYKKFAKHLKKEYTDEQLEKMTDKEITKWFADYAKDHPKHARQPEAAEVKTKPLTNGRQDNERPTLEQQTVQKKTAAPGRPNSMTAREAKEAAKKDGLSW